MFGYVIPHLYTDLDAYQFYRVAPEGMMLVTTGLNLKDYSLAAVEQELPTFWAKNFPFHNGDRVKATEDIFTYLAWVILSSTDPDAVETDYRWVREREAQIRIDAES